MNLSSLQNFENSYVVAYVWKGPELLKKATKRAKIQSEFPAGKLKILMLFSRLEKPLNVSKVSEAVAKIIADQRQQGGKRLNLSSLQEF